MRALMLAGCLAVAGFALPSLSAIARAETLSLPDALERVRREHPDVLRARAVMMQARARVGVALASYLPSAVVGVLGRGDLSNFTPVVVGTPQASSSSSTSFPFEGSYRYSAALNATQLIFDGGQTLGALAAARAQQAAATSDVATQLQLVEGALSAAYVALLEAQALAGVTREYEEQLRALVQSTKNLVRAGVRPEFDALSAETRAQRATLDRVRADGVLARRRAALIAALGLESDPGYTLVEFSLPASADETASLEALVAQAMSARPELRALSSAVRAAEDQVRAARGTYFPSLRLGLTALMTGNQDIHGPLFNFFGSLTLEEELFTGLSTYRGTQAARQAVLVASAQAASQRVMVRASIADAVATLTAALTTDAQSDQLLAQSTRLSQSAQRRYDAGLLSFLELMDAHGLRLIASGQRASARYALALARADLRRSLGRSLIEEHGRR